MKKFAIEKSIGFGVIKIWYWKKFQIQFRSYFGYHHTLYYVQPDSSLVKMRQMKEGGKGVLFSSLVVIFSLSLADLLVLIYIFPRTSFWEEFDHFKNNDKIFKKKRSNINLDGNDFRHVKSF